MTKSHKDSCQWKEKITAACSTFVLTLEIQDENIRHTIAEISQETSVLAKPFVYANLVHTEGFAKSIMILF